jgi:hypothetical protein
MRERLLVPARETSSIVKIGDPAWPIIRGLDDDVSGEADIHGPRASS